MIKIFALASGRSGTKYLSELFKYNVPNCITKHEPYFDMFGKPIYWYQAGDSEKIRRRFKLKKKLIQRYHADVYLETNHAFLKSFADIAMESFPDMKLVHLIRNPLEVAKSQYHRPVWIGKPQSWYYTTFYSYRGDDRKKYLKWALTGNEQIYQDITLNLTRYQQLLVQWIELENRAITFLDTYKKQKDCITFNSPKDLNDKQKLQEMFTYFNIKTHTSDLIMEGKKNVAKTPTIVTNEDHQQLQKLVHHLPDRYLQIFHHPPYNQFKWAELLQKNKKG